MCFQCVCEFRSTPAIKPSFLVSAQNEHLLILCLLMLSCISSLWISWVNYGKSLNSQENNHVYGTTVYALIDTHRACTSIRAFTVGRKSIVCRQYLSIVCIVTVNMYNNMVPICFEIIRMLKCSFLFTVNKWTDIRMVLLLSRINKY